MFSVIFFKTQAGNEPVLDWLRGLDADDRRRIGEDLRTVQIGWPMGMPLCGFLGNGLNEVRVSLAGKRIARIIFFQRNDNLIVVGGFIKKTQKTPTNELDNARNRKAEYERNVLNP